MKLSYGCFPLLIFVGCGARAGERPDASAKADAGSDDLGFPTTPGDRGVLQFYWRSGQPQTTLDYPALEGSRVALMAVGPLSSNATADWDHSGAGKTEGYAPTTLGTITSNGATGEIFISIDANQAGTGTLAVVDGAKLIDKVSVTIDLAERTVVTLMEGVVTDEYPKQIFPDAQGVFRLPRYMKLDLDAAVFNKKGKRLMFTQHGLDHTYSDKTVVGPDLLPNGEYPLGSTNTEPILTKKAGTATVTVVAHGHSEVVSFEVQ